MVLVLVVVQIRAFAPPLGSWLARSAVVVSPCAVPLPARLLFSPGPAPLPLPLGLRPRVRLLPVLAENVFFLAHTPGSPAPPPPSLRPCSITRPP